MWAKQNRRRYDRSGLRYETDLTDDEWAEIVPMLPPAKPGGNKRSEASPTAAIIDAQSIKSAEKGGARIDPNGYDAGKKVKGKKRHVMVDTEGMLLHAIVTAVDIQDRDGGAWLLGTLCGLYPEALRGRRIPGTRIPRVRESGPLAS